MYPKCLANKTNFSAIGPFSTLRSSCFMRQLITMPNKYYEIDSTELRN